jgi:hypothetical protein
MITFPVRVLTAVTLLLLSWAGWPDRWLLALAGTPMGGWKWFDAALAPQVVGLLALFRLRSLLLAIPAAIALSVVSWSVLFAVGAGLY